MPTHEPELSEPYYSGTFTEAGYGSEATYGVVAYFYTQDDGYSYDPDAPGEVEWLEESVLSGGNVDWSTDDDRRQVGVALLMHHLARDPTDEEMDTFMAEIAPEMREGLEFSIGVSKLTDAGLER